MPLTCVSFYIETVGPVSTREIAESVGALFERSGFPYRKPAFISAGTDEPDPDSEMYFLKDDSLARQIDGIDGKSILSADEG